MRKAKCVARIFIVVSFVLSSVHVRAQDLQPVKWQFSAVSVSDHKVKLLFTASLEDGWHIYSQFLEEGGPLPTTFTFQSDNNFSLQGKVKEESEPYKTYDETFMMPIVWYDRTAIFSQEVKLRTPATVVKGKIEFMVCNGELCLPPEEIPFSVEVKAADPGKHSKGK
jgi:thiol:disulfide interchange protein DsbD